VIGPRQAGVAAATVNAAVQVGASLGTALLNTVASGVTAAYLAGRQSSAAVIDHALVHVTGRRPPGPRRFSS
jgi:hypothetical protein